MLRITAYADRLESDLESLDWSEGIKALQRNWIGRSTGAEVDFFIGRAGDQPRAAEEFRTWAQERSKTGFHANPGDDVLRIYTTRPDTLFGATYMVLAPEHPFVDRLTTGEQREAVNAYRASAARKSDLDRTDLAKVKTGVFTGSFALNPVNGQAIPIWIADYVLMGYGTGAIMAVPAHDTRDFEFARQFGLPIVEVVWQGGAGTAGQASSGTHGAGEARSGTQAARQASNDNIADRSELTEAFTGDGTAVNSGKYNGLPTGEFKERITADLVAAGLGCEAVNYKLRDWLFSRQHFWGEPFPILHELNAAGQPTGRTRTLRHEELPLDLPEMPDFKPHDRPEPPLEQAPDDWLYPVIDGVRYKRETNTMPQWAGSCWYYLRFLDPRNGASLVDPALERAWMPVDLYVGGAEHAVLHLLYSRFWHKVLYDRGLVSTPEPFAKLVNQGMILGEVETTGYQRADGSWISADEVAGDEEGDRVERATGQRVTVTSVPPQHALKQADGFVLADDPSVRLESRAYKMSKSRGNVVNPDDVVRQYGADSLRLYEMFMGPLEATKPWSMAGVSGVRGFLDRAWRMIVDERADAPLLSDAVQPCELSAEQSRMLHKTIRDVTSDIDNMSFNTAIAKLMEFTNYFTKLAMRPRAAIETFVFLLSPLAPHIAEELWQVLGHDASLAYEPWPAWDESLIRSDTVEVPVQINGKLRSRVSVPAECGKEELEQVARADSRIAGLLAGARVAKVVVVPGRMVNFVLK